MNWNEIIIKRTAVKTKDSARCGYVAGEYKDNRLIIEGSVISKKYLIPKDKVGDYDGDQLSLTMRHDEISLNLQI